MPHVFGRKLRALRQQRQISQTALARQLGLASHAHINNLEASRRAPSLDLVLQLADFFGVTTDYLLRDGVPVEAETPHAPQDCAPPATRSGCFREKLRTLRKQHRLTQTELSEQMALRTQAHISLLESGHSEPSLTFVLQLADFFGVTTDYLLRDTPPDRA